MLTVDISIFIEYNNIGNWIFC